MSGTIIESVTAKTLWPVLRAYWLAWNWYINQEDLDPLDWVCE